MESKTKKRTTTKKEPAAISHFDPNTCPGRQYFERRDATDREMLTEIVQNAVGEIPKYMKIAGENRVWLFLLTFLVLLDTGMIVALLITVSKIPQ